LNSFFAELPRLAPLNYKNIVKGVGVFLFLFFVLSSNGQNKLKSKTHQVNGYEDLLAGWNNAEINFRNKLGLSKSEYSSFKNFYSTRLDSMRLEYARKIWAGKITEENVRGYLAFIQSQEIFLYKQFKQIKKEFPSSVSEYEGPDQSKPFTTCNSGCTNIDFSNGTLSGWNAFYAVNNSTTTNLNITGVTGGPCGAVTVAANDPNSNLSGAATDYQISIAKPGGDPLVPAIPMVYPGGTSGYSVRLGDSTNPNQGVAIINQTFLVSNANANLTYEYAVFLENPAPGSAHSFTEQPFFNQVLLNQNGDTISHCLNYDVVSSNASQFGFDSVRFYNNPNSQFDYVKYHNWVQVFADLQHYIGQCVTLQFESADCAPGGHFGYAYVSASCNPLSVINSVPNICGDVTLNAPAGAKSYAWTGPAGGIVGPANAQSVTVSISGTYSVVIAPVTGQACADTLALNVVISTAPPIRDSLLSLTNATCFGYNNGSILVGAKGVYPPLRYVWSNGEKQLNDTALVAGIYTLTITDTSKCVATFIDTVKQPALLVGQIASVLPLCPGQTATLTASATGGTKPYTYIWDSTSIGQSYKVAPTVTTVYTLNVTDSNKCKDAPLTISVSVNPKPTVKFTADSVVGCYPMCVTFTDRSKALPDSINKWTWNFGDGDSSNARNPDHCFTKTGNFTISLKVTSDSGCVADTTLVKMITTYNHPNPAFIESPQTTDILEPNVLYTDKSTDGYGIVRWLWEFNNEGLSYDTLQNPPIITYKDTGVQCTKLIVMNIHGCIDSTTECVDIQPVYAIYVPNAFSPNNDGKNDVFLPQGIGICGFDMYIYDRWGSPVFHTTDLYQGWNGIVAHGKGIAQEDTYIYLINTIDCVHHDGHRYVGNVTLIK